MTCRERAKQFAPRFNSLVAADRDVDRDVRAPLAGTERLPGFLGKGSIFAAQELRSLDAILPRNYDGFY